MLKKPTNDGKIFLKSVAEIPITTRVVSDHIRDFKGYQHWIPMLHEVNIIESLDSHTDIIYLKFVGGACLLRDARDFCVVRQWFQTKDHGFIHVSHSVKHNKSMPKAQVIRGEIDSSGYIITPKKDDPSTSVVVYIFKFDLKDVPYPIANLAIGKLLQHLILLRTFLISLPKDE